MELLARPVRPHLPRDNPAAHLVLRFPTVDRHRPCHRLDRPRQVVCRRTALLHPHQLHGNFVERPPARVHRRAYLIRRKIRLRLIAVVNPVRRKKNEGQDQRHHHVVVDAAPLMRPPDIALQHLSQTQRLTLLHAGGSRPAHPYRVPAPPARAPFRPPADSSPESPATCAPPPARCRSACERTPACRPSPYSGCSPAAPGTPRSSSTS